MAVVFPQGIEVFANSASCVATSTYGTTNPAAGTTETWTMGTGYTTFPVAQNTAVPNNYFYVRDPADTTNEIVLVSNNNSSGSPGTTWNVQRGMNGATVAHASGATWVQVVAPYTLASFKQTPGANSTSPTTVANTTTETVLASYTPLAVELQAGNTWDVVAYGTYGVLATGTRPTLQFALYWGGSGSVGGAYTATGGAALTKILTGTNALGLITSIAAGASFDVNGTLTWLSATTATANLNLFYQNGSLTVAGTSASSVNATAGGASSATAVAISGNGPIFLTAKWSAASASNTLTATAPLVYRAA